MGNTFFFEWEVSVIQWIQSWIGTVGVTVASALTVLGETVACIAVLGFLYWCWDKEYGKFVGLNVIAGTLLNPMIKNIFLRRRPYFDAPGVKCLKPVTSGADIYDISAQGYSFPSGHSTNAVTLYTSLWRYKRSKILFVIGLVLPLLVGISRVVLGVHFPTDVICGWLLGTVIIFVIPLLQRAVPNRWIFYGILLAVTIPGWFYCRSDDYYTAFGILIGFILGIEFEAKWVKFSVTRNPLRWLLRIALGVGVYFGLSYLLKLPFDKTFLASGTMLAYTVRAVRYCVILFAMIGIYPLLFRVGDRIFSRHKAKDDTAAAKADA